MSSPCNNTAWSGPCNKHLLTCDVPAAEGFRLSCPGSVRWRAADININAPQACPLFSLSVWGDARSRCSTFSNALRIRCRQLSTFPRPLSSGFFAVMSNGIAVANCSQAWESATKTPMVYQLIMSLPLQPYLNAREGPSTCLVCIGRTPRFGSFVHHCHSRAGRYLPRYCWQHAHPFMLPADTLCRMS